MENIIWIDTKDLVKIHEDIINTSGGLPGFNTSNSVESIMLRVQNHAFYVGVNDFPELAAILAFSIVKGHAFNDGNKRTALIALDVFCTVNQHELITLPHDIVETLVRIADNGMNQAQFTEWLKHRIRRK
jgi:death-on-curing protein